MGGVVAEVPVVRLARPGLAAEWERADPRLYAMVRVVAEWMAGQGLGLPLLTSVERTHAQNAALYLGRVPPPSPHVVTDARGRRTQKGSRAVDVRTRLWPRGAAEALVALLNRRFPRADGFPAALYHDAGTGFHLHLQVSPPYQERST